MATELEKVLQMEDGFSKFLMSQHYDKTQVCSPRFEPTIRRVAFQAMANHDIASVCMVLRVGRHLCQQNHRKGIYVLLAAGFADVIRKIFLFIHKAIVEKRDFTSEMATNLRLFNETFVLLVPLLGELDQTTLLKSILEHILSVIATCYLEWRVTFQFVDTLNQILSVLPRDGVYEIREQLLASKDLIEICKRFIARLHDLGDIQTQSAVIELVARLTPSNLRISNAVEWNNGSEDLGQLFASISYAEIEKTTRAYLNAVNDKEDCLVLSAPYTEARLGSRTFSDSEFCWIDFCNRSGRISLGFPMDEDSEAYPNCVESLQRDVVQSFSVKTNLRRNIELTLSTVCPLTSIFDNCVIEEPANDLVVKFAPVPHLNANVVTKWLQHYYKPPCRKSDSQKLFQTTPTKKETEVIAIEDNMTKEKVASQNIVASSQENAYVKVSKPIQIIKLPARETTSRNSGCQGQLKLQQLTRNSQTRQPPKALNESRSLALSTSDRRISAGDERSSAKDHSTSDVTDDHNTSNTSSHHNHSAPDTTINSSMDGLKISKANTSIQCRSSGDFVPETQVAAPSSAHSSHNVSANLHLSQLHSSHRRPQSGGPQPLSQASHHSNYDPGKCKISSSPFIKIVRCSRKRNEKVEEEPTDDVLAMASFSSNIRSPPQLERPSSKKVSNQQPKPKASPDPNRVTSSSPDARKVTSSCVKPPVKPRTNEGPTVVSDASEVTAKSALVSAWLATERNPDTIPPTQSNPVSTRKSTRELRRRSSTSSLSSSSVVAKGQDKVAKSGEVPTVKTRTRREKKQSETAPSGGVNKKKFSAVEVAQQLFDPELDRLSQSPIERCRSQAKASKVPVALLPPTTEIPKAQKSPRCEITTAAEKLPEPMPLITLSSSDAAPEAKPGPKVRPKRNQTKAAKPPKTRKPRVSFDPYEMLSSDSVTTRRLTKPPVVIPEASKTRKTRSSRSRKEKIFDTSGVSSEASTSSDVSWIKDYRREIKKRDCGEAPAFPKKLRTYVPKKRETGKAKPRKSVDHDPIMSSSVEEVFTPAKDKTSDISYRSVSSPEIARDCQMPPLTIEPLCDLPSFGRNLNRSFAEIVEEQEQNERSKEKEKKKAEAAKRKEKRASTRKSIAVSSPVEKAPPLKAKTPPGKILVVSTPEDDDVAKNASFNKKSREGEITYSQSTHISDVKTPMVQTHKLDKMPSPFNESLQLDLDISQPEPLTTISDELTQDTSLTDPGPLKKLNLAKERNTKTPDEPLLKSGFVTNPKRKYNSTKRKTSSSDVISSDESAEEEQRSATSRGRKASKKLSFSRNTSVAYERAKPSKKRHKKKAKVLVKESSDEENDCDVDSSPDVDDDISRLLRDVVKLYRRKRIKKDRPVKRIHKVIAKHNCDIKVVWQQFTNSRDENMAKFSENFEKMTKRHNVLTKKLTTVEGAAKVCLGKINRLLNGLYTESIATMREMRVAHKNLEQANHSSTSTFKKMLMEQDARARADLDELVREMTF